MNTGLCDSFQLASGGVLNPYTGHNFARMPATTLRKTHVSNHTYFEMAVLFQVCSKPLPHKEVRRNLEDPPEVV